MLTSYRPVPIEAADEHLLNCPMRVKLELPIKLPYALRRLTQECLLEDLRSNMVLLPRARIHLNRISPFSLHLSYYICQFARNSREMCAK